VETRRDGEELFALWLIIEDFGRVNVVPAPGSDNEETGSFAAARFFLISWGDADLPASLRNRNKHA
jgi:hypothetical protein